LCEVGLASAALRAQLLGAGGVRLSHAHSAVRKGVEMTDDQQIQDRIEELVEREHALLNAAAQHSGLDATEHKQLEAVKVELDRYWDLLRQRRAHEEFGLDPDNTSVRDAETVEGYEG